MVLAAVLVYLWNPQVQYTTQTRAKLKPAKEWRLERSSENTLASVVTNNRTGSVQSLKVIELNRGDVMVFELDASVYDQKKVEKGDTIGEVFSNQQRQALVALRGELEVLESRLEYHLAGQKPEDIERAERELLLAEQDLMTQEKLMARSRLLMQDSVISVQQFEIDENELKLKRIAREVAKARLESLKAGDKPEQILLVESQIAAARQRLNQLEEATSLLQICAPMGGRVHMNRDYATTDAVLTISDTTHIIGVAPLMLRDKMFFQSPESGVYQSTSSMGWQKIGVIDEFNTTSQLINGKPVVFFTFDLSQTLQKTHMGELIEIECRGDELSWASFFWEHFTRPTN